VYPGVLLGGVVVVCKGGAVALGGLRLLVMCFEWCSRVASVTYWKYGA
jgi:hypothetical protein